MVAADPDDDIFLHCVSIARADYILSGDSHLLELGQYVGIPIMTVHDFFAAAFPELID
jgi:predicted nucleic acid-binding protein